MDLRRKSRGSSRAGFRLLVFFLAALVAPAAAGAQSLKGLHVCIDPGHGGQGYSASYTGGFAGPTTGLTESKAALDIALLLREQFRRRGAEVTMTRTKNRRVTPEGTTAEEEMDARPRIAKEAGADLLISIHLSSSSKNPNINATRVFYYGEHSDIERLFGVAIGRSLSNELGTTFNAPQEQAQRVIARADMPAILVEVSSISNPKEELRLAKLSYARKAAQAIFDGFSVAYTNIPPQMLETTTIVAAEPTPEPRKTETKREDGPAFRRPAAAKPSPAPRPVQTPAKPRATPRAQPTGSYVPLRPILKNPVTGPIDQAWLYGERYGDLPLQTGLCFDVPEDSLVVAAAGGVVELVVPHGESPPAVTGADVAPYGGMVVIRHEEPTLDGETIWTVYARMPEIFVSPGEKVAALEVLGKTGRPYDGSPESRASAFLFEVRVGHNSSHKTTNPSPLITRGDGAAPTGAIALRLVDPEGIPLEGVEVRGAEKPAMPRFGYALSYQRGVNPSAQFGENLYIGDVPPGSYRLVAEDAALTLRVKPGHATAATWTLKRR